MDQQPAVNTAARVAAVLGHAVRRCTPIGGGAAGVVYRCWLDDGSTVVLKQGERLDVEARSLNALAERSTLPVPRVLHAEPTMLMMSDLGEGGGGGAGVERDAARLLADLHDCVSTDGRYGFDFETSIGPLPQPNAWSGSWVEFYGERRLGAMSDAAAREGVLPRRPRDRLNALRSRLGELVPDRPQASLVHGDIWSGNVISRDDRIAGFIDPAPHYAHAEIELAFITMFETFGPAFFDAYAERRGIEPEFWARRRLVYLLYPLLTHIRIYRGGGYVGQLEEVLGELGF